MSTKPPPLLVNCPLCQAEFRTRPFTKPRQIRCPQCHNEVQLIPPESAFCEPPPIQEAPFPQAETDPQDLLDYLEDLFLKMIVGVFRFILVKVPWELWCLLTTWFPTAIRSLKVTLLGVLWLLLAFGPMVLISHPLVAQTPWESGANNLPSCANSSSGFTPAWLSQTPSGGFITSVANEKGESSVSSPSLFCPSQACLGGATKSPLLPGKDFEISMSWPAHDF